MVLKEIFHFDLKNNIFLLPSSSDSSSEFELIGISPFSIRSRAFVNTDWRIIESS